MSADILAQIAKLKSAIAQLRDQQAELGIDQTAQIAQLTERLQALATAGGVQLTSGGDATVGGDAAGRDTVTNTGAGAVATEGGVAGGQIAVGGDVKGNVTVIGTQINQAPAPSAKALSLPEALRHYLDNLIAAHQNLRLQGIRTDQPMGVSLEKVYVSLTAIDQRRAPDSAEAQDFITGRDLTIGAAVERYRRLVIIGDPGCGKTTLLAYLALTYARSLRDGEALVKERLGLEAEADYLPVLLPLRDFGRHLRQAHPESSKDGPALLLDYLREYYAAQEIHVPEDFFAQFLTSGKATVLLDGLDEVADPALRQRVARLVEKFVVRYPKSRYVITSRVVGYSGPARLGEQFGLAKIRDFTPAEVRQFVREWTLAVETAVAGNAEPVTVKHAQEEAEKLIRAIDGNPRVADLAVNPLLLTVVAMVHRYRASLPEKRSELYEEAVEVLLAGWDKAKGLDTETQLAGRVLDSGDRRSLLEPVAFWLHERKRREIELDELRPLLLPTFLGLAANDQQLAAKAVEEFLSLVYLRSGLLVGRGQGMYAFAHLTFQEYLAARALANREDFVAYTLKRTSDPWWRETILLEAGYLGTQGKRRVSALIRAIMDADSEDEPEPHHHLLLAAECLYDVGGARVEGDLLGEVKGRLKRQADVPVKEKTARADVLQKVTALNALSRIESRQLGAPTPFWKPPWGEPEWVHVPAGEFWMGEADELHRVHVAEFHVAKVPITNAQYALFVKDVEVSPPDSWRGGQPPKDREGHPVVEVSWRDALAYCEWLSVRLGRAVRLPTEAEWEKAARAGTDRRMYPWGDEWQEFRCNSEELGLGSTSPVGLFTSGASPYGVLDMAGNVWEWCQSKKKPYPYKPDDGREKLDGDELRALRGGSFNLNHRLVRCAHRLRSHSDLHSGVIGFRVCGVPRLLTH